MWCCKILKTHMSSSSFSGSNVIISSGGHNFYVCNLICILSTRSVQRLWSLRGILLSETTKQVVAQMCNIALLLHNYWNCCCCFLTHLIVHLHANWYWIFCFSSATDAIWCCIFFCLFCSNFFHLLLILQYMYLFSSALPCTSFNYVLLWLILKKILTSCMESSNVDIEQLQKFKTVYCCDTCLGTAAFKVPSCKSQCPYCNWSGVFVVAHLSVVTVDHCLYHTFITSMY